MLLINITDTGVGIDENKLGNIFKPFVRIKGMRSNLAGTGVGLTITEKLVTAMGGKIGVSSVLGVGSTFSVELPGGTVN